MNERSDNTDPDRIRTVSNVLEGHDEVAAAYLYGSFPARRMTPLSDVEVALVPRGTSPKRRGALLRELTVALERACPGVPFDVRFLDELPVSIRGRVVTEGCRVVGNDPARRLEAEVGARMEYHDFLLFEREGTREGLRGLREAVRDG